MPIKRIPRAERRELSLEQKVAFVLLLFLAIGGVFLGFRSFGVNIRRPFDLQIANYLSGDTFVPTSTREQQELEASKSRDTDGDELTDYDELSVYKTSPYLTDSDSDGFDDKTEVFSGNDPTCPKEKDCSVVTEEVVPEDTSMTGLIEAFGNSASILASGEFDFENPEDVENFFKQATLQEIRNALIQAGVPKEDLDQISDEELSAFFNSTLQQASEQGVFDPLVTSSSENVIESSAP